MTLGFNFSADINVDTVYYPPEEEIYVIKYFPGETIETDITIKAEDFTPFLPETTTIPETTAEPETTTTRTTITALKPPTQPPETKPPIQYVGRKPYDYTKPVPLSETVDKSYFDDAVFIGDSRMYGFCIYNELPNNYAQVSFSTKGYFSKSFLFYEDDPEKTYTIPEALKLGGSECFKKVYIALGLNELGSVWTFIVTYESIINSIKETLPDALIYIQEIIPATKERSDENSYGVTNETIRIFNEALLDLAKRKEVFYLAVGGEFTDKNGDMVDDRSIVAGSDGVHMTGKAARIQLEYFSCHVVDFEKDYLYPWEKPEIYKPPEETKEPEHNEKEPVDRDNSVVNNTPDELQ